MEIKSERLANGNIMATDCLGRLGHANEAASASSGGKIDMYGQSAGPKMAYISNATQTYMYACTSTHTNRE